MSDQQKTATALFGGKTAISLLQELCTKRTITPTYSLVANEGAVHEPIFKYQVVAGNFTGTGKGSSKKKARHAAAAMALRMMGAVNGEMPEVNLEQDKPVSQPATPFDDGIPGNPIGELQEFTQKRLMRPPIYKFPTEQGPPHARQFIAVVTLGKMEETGAAKSKRVAKREAASKMLAAVRQIVASQDNDLASQLEEPEDDGIPTIPKETAKIPSLTSHASKKISAFYSGMKSATGKSLASLQNKQLNSPSTNYCQLLQQIAEEQRFEVTYVNIGEPGPAGHSQCLVQLSTMPVAVCHGTGPTQDEAHAQAAHNALEYLKIMTKKA